VPLHSREKRRAVLLLDKKLRACDQTRAIATHRVAEAISPLILFTESLDVRFAVRIEELFAALLPRRFEFGGGDFPVRPAFLGNGTYVLAEIFQSGPAGKPVTVIDLTNHQTGLEHNHVGDHGIVERIRVFGDVDIFLDHTPRVGKERPVGTDSAAIFVRLSDIVGANCD
jgi:hypothetical protein